MLPSEIAHREQLRLHKERQEKRAIERAKAIFELVNMLAQARAELRESLSYLMRVKTEMPDLPDDEYHQAVAQREAFLSRIDAALRGAHIALDGEWVSQLPPEVIPIVKRA